MSNVLRFSVLASFCILHIVSIASVYKQYTVSSFKTSKYFLSTKSDINIKPLLLSVFKILGTFIPILSNLILISRKLSNGSNFGGACISILVSLSNDNLQ